jgi:nitric oxide reductase large subunit
VFQLIITSNIVPSSSTLATLMMEAIRFYETLLLTRATRRNIPENGIRHNQRRENLKSFIALTYWVLLAET